nr:hypothetical protein [Tanacetum cinerariifolium]
MCMSYTDVAQVANAARNYKILHERDDDDTERPDKRRSGGDNHRSNNNYSGRIPVMGVTRETGVSSPTDLPILTPRRVSSTAGTCFKCGQAGHLQKDCKKNTTASTSGQADKKPGASGRVFTITEGHAANTSGTITGTLFIYGHAVFVLFDTGATRSVISSAFASRITTKPTLLDHVANAARNYEILHERDDDDTEQPDKRSSGNGRDQRNRGQQSNRSANFGECRRAAGTCFKCGQAGHLQKDCKKNTTASTSGQADKKPGASGRVFAITKGHAANTSGTITGILFIYGHAVFVLFDTGATHYVISSAFSSRVTTTPTLLDHVLCISTPMQDSVRINYVYRNLPLQVDDKIRAINALPLGEVREYESSSL